ncbi:MAG: hypothetical protein KGK07_15745 [Chloroflexota bacterium]|nr:hypothetical protein [Chloroflexota bacterium]
MQGSGADAMGYHDDLTAPELEVLALAARGQSNRQIALNLAHPNGDGHGALMNDGAGMLELNTYERDGVRTHY